MNEKRQTEGKGNDASRVELTSNRLSSDDRAWFRHLHEVVEVSKEN